MPEVSAPLALFDTQEQIVKPFVLVVLLPDALMITIARFCRQRFLPNLLVIESRRRVQMHGDAREVVRPLPLQDLYCSTGERPIRSLGPLRMGSHGTQVLSAGPGQAGEPLQTRCALLGALPP